MKKLTVLTALALASQATICFAGPPQYLNGIADGGMSMIQRHKVERPVQAGWAIDFQFGRLGRFWSTNTNDQVSALVFPVGAVNRQRTGCAVRACRHHNAVIDYSPGGHNCTATGYNTGINNGAINNHICALGSNDEPRGTVTGSRETSSLPEAISSVPGVRTSDVLDDVGGNSPNPKISVEVAAMVRLSELNVAFLLEDATLMLENTTLVIFTS